MSVKPEPVVVRTVCSLCDELWEAHGDKPSTLDCIRLLKLRRFVPTLYPIHSQPIAPYWRPGTWYSTTSGGMIQNNASATTSDYLSASSTVYKTPTVA